MSIKTQSEVLYSNVFYRPENLKIGDEIFINNHPLAGKYCYTKKYIKKRNPLDILPREYMKEYSFNTKLEAMKSLRKKSIIDRIGSENEMCVLRQEYINIEHSES